VSTRQAAIDAGNQAFWQELCGSSLARDLGISHLDGEGLRRFDAAYMAYYPYLWGYLPRRLDGVRVLEIGLGFGTVGHVLAARGAEYHGVDIARGPLALMRYRLSLLGLPPRVQQASALALPFPDAAFDAVYSIGCLHHAGDLAVAIAEVYRAVRPAGRVVVMLYNRRSARRLVRAPARRRSPDDHGARLRALYDANLAGTPPPHTDFVTRAGARRLFHRFGRVQIDAQNCDALRLRGRLLLSRERLLGSLGRTLGLDLYVRAER